MNVIEARGLHKRYGALTAVDNLSFSVSRGEVFGLLGPNGAGKTTTLEMLEGLRKPDGGQAHIFGLEVTRHRREIQARIGVQLQSTSLFDDLTVQESVDLFASLFPGSKGSAARRGLGQARGLKEELLERLALVEKRHSPVAELSGGQKQRLALALSLVNEPELVFLDEPTTGLDPQARRNLWDVIRDLKASGKTVILTTHYMDEAQTLCDRVAIMDSARIIAQDTPQGLIESLPFSNTIEASLPNGDFRRLVEGLPGTERVTTLEETLIIGCSRLDETLVALIGLAQREGIPVKDLKVRQATLEDVFISLTGKRLRE